MQEDLHGRVETAHGLTDPFPMPGVACGQGHECSPTRSKMVAAFIQRMASRVAQGYRFHEKGVPSVWYADDAAFLAEDVAGLQMAYDAAWVVARVAGLKIGVKKEGTKSAWMGTYYDAHGIERELDPYTIGVDGKVVPLIQLPDGREIPKVTKYVHLGTPLQSKWEGRLQPACDKIVSKCKHWITLIGRIDALGPRQINVKYVKLLT